MFEGGHDAFLTRPDLIEVSAEVTPGPAADRAFDGVVLLSPRDTAADEQVIANAILDGNGDPLWLQPTSAIEQDGHVAHNLLVQDYGGEPVLTWWEGDNLDGHGFGEVVVADTS